jgi:competence protein ComEC
MLTWLLAASLTLILSSFSPILPSNYWATGLTLVSICLLYRPKIIFLSGLSFALAWAIFYGNSRMHTTLPVSLEKQDITIVGRVCDLPKLKQYSQKFVFCVEQLIASPVDASEFAAKKILLAQYDRANYVKVGQRWRFKVRLKRVHGFANRHGFLYEKHLVQNGIDASGYIRKDVHNHQLEHSWHWQQIRGFIRDTISSIMVDNQQYLGVVLALTIGDKSRLTRGQWQALTATGTNHLLAISGLHIALVAGLVFFIANLIAKLLIRTGRVASIQYAAACSLVAAIAYAVLAGLSLPTQRAIIMLSVYLLAIMFKRELASSFSLVLAAFLVLVFDPLAPQSASFWLSFIAVAIIMLFIKHMHSRNKSSLQLLYSYSRAQWLFFIGLLPVLVIIFGKFSYIAPLVNLVAIPWLGFLVIPLCLLAVCILSLPVIASYVLLSANWLLAIFMQTIIYLSSLPIMANFLYLSSWQIILLLIAALLLLLPQSTPVKSLALICLVPLVFTAANNIKNGEFKINILDVGQGLAVVVRTHSYTLVYDVGRSFSPNLDAGRDIVVPFLQGEGITHIDQLVLSHADGDHVGGLEGVLANIGVDQISSSEAAKLTITAGRAITSCKQGDTWQVDGVTFSFLHPQRQVKYKKRNDRSCVLKISSQYGAALLPGDINASIEDKLIATTDVSANLLIAAHHGSKTSSRAKFIAAVAPEDVVYSAGYLNSYHHPHPSVTRRYTAAQVRQTNTATSGEVEFYFSDAGIHKQAFRDRWFRPYYLRY